MTTLPSAILLLLAHVLLPGVLRTQALQLDQRTVGQTYVLAFPDTVTNTFDARFPNRMEDKLYIYIYSSTSDNQIAVTGNGYNRLFTGQAGKFTIVDLTDPAFKAPLPIVTVPNTASKNIFRVEAEAPVVVYCYMVTKFGAEAWTPIPVEHWGTEYYAAGHQGEIGKDIYPRVIHYDAVQKPFPAEILVVAAYDNTVVTIQSNGRLTDSTFQSTFTLMKDEAYLVQSFVDTTQWPGELLPDLAGSYITSSKPIGVISGNTRAQVIDELSGLGKNFIKNMMIEWIAPVEQHGREFVYMPTMDDRRPTGLSIGDSNGYRTAEFVRIYATNPQGKKTTGYSTDPVSGSHAFFQIGAPRGFHEHRNGIPEAVYYKTDSAAQAFMATSAVVKFLGTTGSGSLIGAKYEGWGTYMVEMTPREQWINSAPFFAPSHPANMEHFINIVTDSASATKIYRGTGNGMPSTQVLLKRRVTGTNLFWGYFRPPVGQDLFITGWDTATGKADPSVKFSGFVYGLYKGHEEYRPERVGRKGDGNDRSVASAAAAEYEEYLGVAYGYPLAPSRVNLRQGDSLQIDKVMMNCDTLDVSIRTLNDNPVGLSSITLDSVSNARIIFVDPSDSTAVFGRTNANFKMAPIDTLMQASAVIVVTDRTKKTWRFRYSYEPACISMGDFNFGQLGVNEAKTMRLTIRNRGQGCISFVSPGGDSVISWSDEHFSVSDADKDLLKNTVLGTNESVSIGVTFKSSREGTFVARAKFFDNTNDQKCKDVSTWTASAIDIAGTVDASYEASGASLSQAEPNPTDGITTFSFTLAHPAFTTLQLYNALGEHIATIVEGDRSAGEHRVDWNLGELPSGMYYYRLRSGTFAATRSLVVH